MEIHLTEQEIPLMLEMLSFIYKGFTSPQVSESFELTLQLLVLTDRFGVKECYNSCMERLNNYLQKVTAKEALLFLELPKFIQELPALKTLNLVSGACLAEHYGPLLSQPESEEFLNLSKPGLELLLKTDNLDVDSEETVYLAIISWVRRNYGDLESRKRVLASFLNDIRFPWMTASFIKGTVMSSDELQSESCQKVIVSSLLFKAAQDEDEEYRKSILEKRFGWSKPRRNYRSPLKSAFFDIPFCHCKIWQPSPGFQASSGSFCVKGKWFTLSAKLEVQKEGGARFGLFLRLEKQFTFPRGESEGEVHCDYQFFLNSGSEKKKFDVVKPRSSCVFAPPTSLGWGSRDLLKKPWSEVLSQSEIYFPNGAMQLRVDMWMEDENPITLVD